MQIVSVLIHIVGGPLCSFAVCLMCLCVGLAVGRYGASGVALWLPGVVLLVLGLIGVWVGSASLVVAGVLAAAVGLRLGLWLASWGGQL